MGLSQMGKIDLPFYQAVKAKGRIYHYYRRDKRRYRIDGQPGTEAFADSYNAIHRSFEVDAGECQPGSVGALIAEYKSAPEWGQLKPRTRKDYDRYLAVILDEWGGRQVSGMTRKHVLRLRDQYIDRPRTGNILISLLSTLMTFGVDREYSKTNPAKGITRMKTGPGYRSWKDWEINALFEHGPDVIVDLAIVALCTGQRQGDVRAMRWDQIEDGVVEVVQEKTGATVWIPVHPMLAERLEQIKARPIRHTTLICTTVEGKAWQRGHLGNKFKQATKALDLDVQFHGLRKAACRMLSEVGCTTDQIKAISGHTTNEMVEHYTRDADRKVNAQAAMKKLEVANRFGKVANFQQKNKRETD